MITNKYITKIIIVIVAAALLLCLGGMIYADRLVEMAGGRAVFMEYESRLFDRDQIMSVDIQIDAEDWEELLAHAIEENYYECDIEINGTTFSNVGIRPKGNTSLTSIANDPDTDRYSLKLEFDRYVEGQTCFGLDKLILNNNYADAANMKEAIVYDMYQYLDADASLYNYAKVSVNGEYWGVYLALEAVEESFLLRNYGVETGELYKPEGMDGNGGDHSERPENPNRQEGAVSEKIPGRGEEAAPEKIPAITSVTPESADHEIVDGKTDRPDLSEGNKGEKQEISDGESGDRPNILGEEQGAGANLPNGDNGDRPNISGEEQGAGANLLNGDNGDRPNFPGRNNGGGPGSMGGKGADLNYTDDELESYTTIWEGAVTDTTDIDHKRVVTALKEIHSGTNLEEYLDVEAVLKYMAVHTFAVNLDSLTGNMPHNYYLYESNGQLNILPWDYNLSFGGMTAGKNSSASETINYPVDMPFSGTQFFDAVLNDETYLAKYHGYLQQLAEEYVQNKRFDTVYTKIRTQIDDLIKTDPTAFYTYDQYDAGAEMLFQTILLRAESVRGQLAGTIPSTSEEQRENPDALVDASEIDLSVMGEFQKDGRDFKEENMQPPSDMETDRKGDAFPVCFYHRKKRYAKSS